MEDNTMDTDLNETFEMASPESEIRQFIKKYPNAEGILKQMHPLLLKRFPNCRLSLEVCDELEWTTERKLIVNVHVSEETFINEMLNHFNDIYKRIDPIIEDDFCPVVLFPLLSNENYDKFGQYSAINLIARTAYFNGEFDENFQREMTLRQIPKDQQTTEIIEYCKSHENPNISDIVFDLQLDLFDVDRIIDELEDEGIDLNVEY